MKFIKKYGLFIPDKGYNKWKKTHKYKPMFNFIEKFLTVTEHGTICRVDLKEAAEKNNIKRKTYFAGLKTSFAPKNRKAKKLVRYSRILKLNKIIKEGKATDLEKALYKKLKFLERGRYNIKYLRRKNK